MQNKVWLVGAKWGEDELFTSFVKNGEWVLGWTDYDVKEGGWPRMFEKAQAIQPGDTIVVKRWCGGGSPGPRFMRIRAKGTVRNTSVQNDHVHCDVDWEDIGPERFVEAGGCRRAVEGPYEYGAGYDAWLDSILKN